MEKILSKCSVQLQKKYFEIDYGFGLGRDEFTQWGLYKM